MKKFLLFISASFISCLSFAQVNLGLSPYIQDFNGIGTALPAGFSLRTGATATAPGTDVSSSYATAVVAWNNATGAYKNFASATGLTSTTAAAQQSASGNRSLGLRQTAAFGDNGAAFVLQLANTTNLANFELSFKLQSLDAASPRQATWRVDYGFGASPSAFTAAPASGTLTTGGSSFSNTTVTVNFGNALNNRSETVWIRIVTLTATTGSGNRPSTGVDDFSLTYTSGTVAAPSLSASPSSLPFGNQPVGTTSASLSHTVSYGNLDGSDLAVSASASFTVAKAASGPFVSSISFTAAEQTGTSLPVYSRFSPIATGAVSGTISHSGGGLTAPVTVSVSGTGISTTPVVANDSFSGQAGEAISGNVSLNDSDPQGLALTFAKLTDPAAGTLTFNSDGTFSYQSVDGVSPQTFTYRATNSQGLSADGSVTVTLAERPKIFISQYYEGASVNKWIELTNPTDAPVNLASPQLKLALYNISGDAGNITITGTPSQVVSLNSIIPAKSSILIGNTGNGTEVPYLTAASAQQTSNSVINFNGNDGLALLDAANAIIDAFGTGVNAKDVSYVRITDGPTPSAVFNTAQWTRTALATVQNAADLDDPDRLGVHVQPDLPDCVSPTSQPTALAFGPSGTKTIGLSFTASPDAGEYLIIRSLNSTLASAPVDGTVYTAGNSLGGGTVAGRIVGTSFQDGNLPSGTAFYYFIYALNSTSCDGGPKYLAPDPLTGSRSTVPLPACAVPPAQAANFQVTFSNYNVIQGTFAPASGADEFLVVMSKNSALSSLPADQTSYTIGDSIGGGIVIKKGASGTFNRSSLDANTTYYFTVFAFNSTCSGGPLYLTSAPLTGSRTTAAFDPNALNFYYGNLHSHSSYSDGNKDDLSKTPVDDYAFAKNSRKMDFLGIAEHNHTQAGMRLANWAPGMLAAKNATTSNFVALYGMEWGVISGGGHVLVYGVDSLIGWEPGEHQIYVPKSTYTGPTGLFNAITRHGLNALATLAHPNSSDYNNIATAYNALADSAIVGTALESGPAFSTNVTYSDAPSSMSYLNYYNRMLARGYRLGASMDHDNHNLTFGRHTQGRLVVLAPSLSENDLLDALKKMRFYASQDSAARITFTLNGQPLGSVFSGNGIPNISVSGSTTSPISTISIIAGRPGDGITPTTLVSTSSGSLTYSDSTLTHLATGYYYADITEADGKRIITSPIWYTRNDSIKTAQVITFGALPAKTYGDVDFSPAATSTNVGIPVTYTSSDEAVAASVNGNIHILKAGTATITASQAGNTLYTPAVSKAQVLTILPKEVRAVIEAKTKTYGDADPGLTYTVSPVLIAGDTFTGSLTRDAGENVGTYTIRQGNLALNSNYSLSVDTARLTITPKSLVITAENKTRQYGSPEPEFTATYSGFATGDGIAALTALPVFASAGTPASPAGSYTITASGAAAANYAISYVDGTLTITLTPQVISFAALPVKTFGDADFNLDATAGASGNPLTFVSSTSAVATVTGSTVHITGAGSAVITASQAGNGGYEPATDIQQTLIVQKALATLSLSTLSQVYDGTPKSVTVTTSPAGLNGVSATYNGSLLVPSAAGSYAVSATLTNANYQAAAVSGTLVIIQPATLKAQFRNADNSPSNGEGRAYLKILNTGLTPVSYSQITARYWITPENFTGALGLWIDYAQLGNNKVTLRYVPLTGPRVKALGYIEYAFNASAGSLAAGGTSGEIQSRFANSDWTVFNELNDHSYKASSGTYADNSQVTLYINGTLVWGTEPVAEAPVVSLKAYSSAPGGGQNSISTYLDLRNEGNVAIDFKDVTARYWFTSDGNAPLNFWIDYAKIGNSAISGSFITVNPAVATANTYLEIKVQPAASTFYPSSATGTIQYRLSKSDWSNFNQANDHSYKSGQMSENNKITLYYKRQLVYGTEPSGAGATLFASNDIPLIRSLLNTPTEEPGLIVYPNPSSGSFTLDLGSDRDGAFKVTIYNAIGTPVDTFSGKKSGRFEKEYQLPLTKGTYYMVVAWGNHTDYRTLLIN